MLKYEDFAAFVSLIIICLFMFLLGYTVADNNSKETINELCNKHQYDFCVLSEKMSEK